MSTALGIHLLLFALLLFFDYSVLFGDEYDTWFPRGGDARKKIPTSSTF